MQLDRTHISIRERNWMDVCDLALHVFRAYARPLAVAFTAGALPMALLNWWLIGGIAGEAFAEWSVVRYLWLMSLLVFIEAPLASVPATLYLGNAMFYEPPSTAQVATTAWKLAGRLILCQGLLRGVAAAWLLAWASRPEQATVFDFLLALVALYALGIRSVRPFLNEIILLEQNPLAARDRKTVTIGRRSSNLHGPSTGSLLGGALASAVLAVVLTYAVAMTLWFAQFVCTFNWEWGPVMIHVLLPASMWLVAGYFTVVRFLSYVDLRIRREGWAVELRLRAEAARLRRQWS